MQAGQASSNNSTVDSIHSLIAKHELIQGDLRNEIQRMQSVLDDKERYIQQIEETIKGFFAKLPPENVASVKGY